MSVELAQPERTITLVTLRNERRRNALDEETFRSLAALWPEIAATDCRCVVLTGAGATFCSGADLTTDWMTISDIDTLIDGALLKRSGFNIPIVAAIEGACVAGGMELALSCDVRIASQQAVFGMPEARWAVFPSGGGAMKLAAEIGYVRASELLLSGRLIDASEAAKIGLVNRVVPVGTALDQAMVAARQIASNSPITVRAIKHYLSTAREPSADLLCLESELTELVRASGDARDGRLAFLEKRDPRYS